MLGLVGPAVAAVFVTAMVHGRDGVRDLAQRIARWRVGWWWLSVIALLLAGTLGLAISGNTSDNGDLTRYSGVPSIIGAAATVILVLVLNGFGEEIGWRGFLAGDLLRRRGVSVAALLVTLAWAPWHIPLFFLVGSFEGFSVGEVVGWVIGLTAGSLVLTWLYAGSGRSILLVAVWHTAFNFTSGTPAADGVAAAVTSTLVMIAAVAIVVADLRRAATPGKTMRRLRRGHDARAERPMTKGRSTRELRPAARHDQTGVREDR